MLLENHVNDKEPLTMAYEAAISLQRAYIPKPPVKINNYYTKR